jgi:hypothetical protein
MRQVHCVIPEELGGQYEWEVSAFSLNCHVKAVLMHSVVVYCGVGWTRCWQNCLCVICLLVILRGTPWISSEGSLMAVRMGQTRRLGP